MTRIYRLLVPLGSLAAVVLVLWASMALAERVPFLRSLSLLAQLGKLDYSADAFARFEPIRPEFLAQSFNDRDLALLLGDTQPARPKEEAERGSVPSPHPAPSPSPNQNPLPEIKPIFRAADLQISMQADRATASPGEDILYTITVRNAGDTPFQGDFKIDSHHPLHTTDSSCEPGSTCVPVPVPGSGRDDLHTVTFSVGYAPGGSEAIEPGEEFISRFRVRVNPGTPADTEIPNHAHLDVVGDGKAPITSNSVVVTVR